MAATANLPVADIGDAEGPPKVYPNWHNAVAGGIAGASSRMLTAPLDLIRIRRQLSPANEVSYPSETIIQSWSTIVRTEGGLRALFRGNLAAIYLWVGYAAVQFSIYNRTKRYLSGHWQHLHPSVAAVLAGSLAGTCATLATYPFDVCRTIFAARGVEQAPRRMPFHSLVEPSYRTVPTRSPPKSLATFATQLFQQKGLQGFYAGAGPAVIQIIPYMGLNFGIYEALTGGDRGVALSGYAGSISGATSKILVYPLDTVKRRLQGQAFYASEMHASGEYRSMVDCFRKIARDEGFQSFYRGVVPSVLKSTIATSLSFAVFRLSKNALEAIHDGES